jgi:parallel beta-helix repeat protein
MLKQQAKLPIMIIFLIIPSILGSFNNSLIFQSYGNGESKIVGHLRQSSKSVIYAHDQSLSTTYYTDHDPIYINSNDDFENLGFPGSGTSDDPFVIERLKISADNCLKISGTTDYLCVKECYFEGFSQSFPGIELNNVKHVTFENNIINNNDLAVALYSSSYINFYNNSIYSNIMGIRIDSSHRNNIKGNKISNNQQIAISLESQSSSNFITWNEFIGNNKDNISYSQAVDNRRFNVNIPEANNSFSYNYWDDWTSPDNNSDGIVDIPYSIQGSNEGNSDRFPLAHLHILTKPTLIYPNGGEILNDTIEIKWVSLNDSFNHSIVYSVYYSTNDGIDWDILISEIIATNYTWDTTLFDDRTNYLIKVVVSCPVSGFSYEDISDQAFSIDNFTVQNSFVVISTLLLPIFIALLTIGVLILLNKQLKSIITNIEDG